MKIAITGDVMLGRLVESTREHEPPEYFWGDTLPILRSADFSLINLECALTISNTKWTRTEKMFHFKADPQRATAILQAAGIKFVNLANNHVLDWETQGLEETLATLDAAGIAHCGAGKNKAEAEAEIYYDLDDLQIAVFGATDNAPEWKANRGPGVNFLRFDGDSGLELVERVAEIKNQADLLIASLHWGPNMRQRPPQEFRDFAHDLIDSGVDIIHGHSAHIPQGIEVYDDKLILYDTGDYIDDYAVDPTLRNDRSFLFMLELKDSMVKVSLLPTIIDHCQVHFSRGRDFRESCETMIELSEEFGTELVQGKDGLHLEVHHFLPHLAGAAEE